MDDKLSSLFTRWLKIWTKITADLGRRHICKNTKPAIIQASANSRAVGPAAEKSDSTRIRVRLRDVHTLALDLGLFQGAAEIGVYIFDNIPTKVGWVKSLHE